MQAAWGATAKQSPARRVAIYGPSLIKRNRIIVLSSLKDQSYVGAASLVALTLFTAVTWHKAQSNSKQSTEKRSGLQDISTGRSQNRLRHIRIPQQLQLPGGWLLTRRQNLIEEWEQIEARKHAESRKALQRWDERFQLRSLSLPKLRVMAQQYKIAGRSRMRKQELIAALEQRLGPSEHV